MDRSSVDSFGMRGGVHAQNFPNVTVGVLDVAIEHEAKILRRIGIGAATRRDGSRNCRIHALTAVRREQKKLNALLKKLIAAL